MKRLGGSTRPCGRAGVVPKNRAVAFQRIKWRQSLFRKFVVEVRRLQHAATDPCGGCSKSPCLVVQGGCFTCNVLDIHHGCLGCKFLRKGRFGMFNYEYIELPCLRNGFSDAATDFQMQPSYCITLLGLGEFPSPPSHEPLPCTILPQKRGPISCARGAGQDRRSCRLPGSGMVTKFALMALPSGGTVSTRCEKLVEFG